MQNIITVQIKNVYGNELVYPACETGKKFVALLGTKTFTNHHIKQIKDLGYEFKEQASGRF